MKILLHFQNYLAFFRKLVCILRQVSNPIEINTISLTETFLTKKKEHGKAIKYGILKNLFPLGIQSLIQISANILTSAITY